MPAPKRCPQCGKPAKVETAPFCSARCQQVDLHRWFTGAYAVPAQEEDRFDGEEGEEEAEGF